MCTSIATCIGNQTRKKNVRIYFTCNDDVHWWEKLRAISSLILVNQQTKMNNGLIWLTLFFFDHYHQYRSIVVSIEHRWSSSMAIVFWIDCLCLYVCAGITCDIMKNELNQISMINNNNNNKAAKKTSSVIAIQQHMYSWWWWPGHLLE